MVADSRYLAEDALALIDVDYAPLPVTVSAWKAGAEVPVHDEAPDNVLLTRTFAAGDVAAAFARADLVLERDLITNRHAGNPLECRAGVALWQPERRRLTRRRPAQPVLCELVCALPGAEGDRALFGRRRQGSAARRHP